MLSPTGLPSRSSFGGTTKIQRLVSDRPPLKVAESSSVRVSTSNIKESTLYPKPSNSVAGEGTAKPSSVGPWAALPSPSVPLDEGDRSIRAPLNSAGATVQHSSQLGGNGSAAHPAADAAACHPVHSSGWSEGSALARERSGGEECSPHLPTGLPPPSATAAVEMEAQPSSLPLLTPLTATVPGETAAAMAWHSHSPSALSDRSSSAMWFGREPSGKRLLDGPQAAPTRTPLHPASPHSLEGQVEACRRIFYAQCGAEDEYWTRGAYLLPLELSVGGQPFALPREASFLGSFVYAGGTTSTASAGVEMLTSGKLFQFLFTITFCSSTATAPPFGSPFESFLGILARGREGSEGGTPIQTPSTEPSLLVPYPLLVEHCKEEKTMERTTPFNEAVEEDEETAASSNASLPFSTAAAHSPIAEKSLDSLDDSINNTKAQAQYSPVGKTSRRGGGWRVYLPTQLIPPLSEERRDSSGEDEEKPSPLPFLFSTHPSATPALSSLLHLRAKISAETPRGGGGEEKIRMESGAATEDKRLPPGEVEEGGTPRAAGRASVPPGLGRASLRFFTNRPSSHRGSGSTIPRSSLLALLEQKDERAGGAPSSSDPLQSPLSWCSPVCWAAMKASESSRLSLGRLWVAARPQDGWTTLQTAPLLPLAQLEVSMMESAPSRSSNSSVSSFTSSSVSTVSHATAATAGGGGEGESASLLAFDYPTKKPKSSTNRATRRARKEKLLLLARRKETRIGIAPPAALLRLRRLSHSTLSASNGSSFTRSSLASTAPGSFRSIDSASFPSPPASVPLFLARHNIRQYTAVVAGWLADCPSSIRCSEIDGSFSGGSRSPRPISHRTAAWSVVRPSTDQPCAIRLYTLTTSMVQHVVRCVRKEWVRVRRKLMERLSALCASHQAETDHRWEAQLSWLSRQWRLERRECFQRECSEDEEWRARLELAEMRRVDVERCTQLAREAEEKRLGEAQAALVNYTSTRAEATSGDVEGSVRSSLASLDPSFLHFSFNEDTRFVEEEEEETQAEVVLEQKSSSFLSEGPKKKLAGVRSKPSKNAFRFLSKSLDDRPERENHVCSRAVSTVSTSNASIRPKRKRKAPATPPQVHLTRKTVRIPKKTSQSTSSFVPKSPTSPKRRRNSGIGEMTMPVPLQSTETVSTPPSRNKRPCTALTSVKECHGSGGGSTTSDLPGSAASMPSCTCSFHRRLRTPQEALPPSPPVLTPPETHPPLFVPFIPQIYFPTQPLRVREGGSEDAPFQAWVNKAWEEHVEASPPLFVDLSPLESALLQVKEETLLSLDLPGGAEVQETPDRPLPFTASAVSGAAPSHPSLTQQLAGAVHRYLSFYCGVEPTAAPASTGAYTSTTPLPTGESLSDAASTASEKETNDGVNSRYPCDASCSSISFGTNTHLRPVNSKSSVASHRTIASRSAPSYHCTHLLSCVPPTYAVLQHLSPDHLSLEKGGLEEQQPCPRPKRSRALSTHTAPADDPSNVHSDQEEVFGATLTPGKAECEAWTRSSVNDSLNSATDSSSGSDSQEKHLGDAGCEHKTRIWQLPIFGVAVLANPALSSLPPTSPTRVVEDASPSRRTGGSRRKESGERPEHAPRRRKKSTTAKTDLPISSPLQPSSSSGLTLEEKEPSAPFAAPTTAPPVLAAAVATKLVSSGNLHHAFTRWLENGVVGEAQSLASPSVPPQHAPVKGPRGVVSGSERVENDALRSSSVGAETNARFPSNLESLSNVFVPFGGVNTAHVPSVHDQEHAIRNIIRTVLQQLQPLHARGIPYGGVCSSNIFLLSNEEKASASGVGADGRSTWKERSERPSPMLPVRQSVDAWTSPRLMDFSSRHGGPLRSTSPSSSSFRPRMENTSGRFTSPTTKNREEQGSETEKNREKEERESSGTRGGGAPTFSPVGVHEEYFPSPSNAIASQGRGRIAYTRAGTPPVPLPSKAPAFGNASASLEEGARASRSGLSPSLPPHSGRSRGHTLLEERRKELETEETRTDKANEVEELVWLPTCHRLLEGEDVYWQALRAAAGGTLSQDDATLLPPHIGIPAPRHNTPPGHSLFAGKKLGVRTSDDSGEWRSGAGRPCAGVAGSPCGIDWSTQVVLCDRPHQRFEAACANGIASLLFGELAQRASERSVAGGGEALTKKIEGSRPCMDEKVEEEVPPWVVHVPSLMNRLSSNTASSVMDGASRYRSGAAPAPPAPLISPPSPAECSSIDSVASQGELSPRRGDALETARPGCREEDTNVPSVSLSVESSPEAGATAVPDPASFLLPSKEVTRGSREGVQGGSWRWENSWFAELNLFPTVEWTGSGVPPPEWIRSEMACVGGSNAAAGSPEPNEEKEETYRLERELLEAMTKAGEGEIPFRLRFPNTFAPVCRPSLASDVWMVGSLLVELAKLASLYTKPKVPTGRALFSGAPVDNESLQNDARLMFPVGYPHHVWHYQDEPFLVLTSDRWSAAMRVFLRRCTRLKPDDRSSVEELLNDPWMHHAFTESNEPVKSEHPQDILNKKPVMARHLSGVVGEGEAVGGLMVSLPSGHTYPSALDTPLPPHPMAALPRFHRAPSLLPLLQESNYRTAGEWEKGSALLLGLPRDNTSPRLSFSPSSPLKVRHPTRSRGGLVESHSPSELLLAPETSALFSPSSSLLPLPQGLTVQSMMGLFLAYNAQLQGLRLTSPLSPPSPSRVELIKSAEKKKPGRHHRHHHHGHRSAQAQLLALKGSLLHLSLTGRRSSTLDPNGFAFKLSEADFPELALRCEEIIRQIPLSDLSLMPEIGLWEKRTDGFAYPNNAEVVEDGSDRSSAELSNQMAVSALSSFVSEEGENEEEEEEEDDLHSSATRPPLAIDVVHRREGSWWDGPTATQEELLLNAVSPFEIKEGSDLHQRLSAAAVQGMSLREGKGTKAGGSAAQQHSMKSDSPSGEALASSATFSTGLDSTVSHSELTIPALSSERTRPLFSQPTFSSDDAERENARLPSPPLPLHREGEGEERSGERQSGPLSEQPLSGEYALSTLFGTSSQRSRRASEGISSRSSTLSRTSSSLSSDRPVAEPSPSAAHSIAASSKLPSPLVLPGGHSLSALNRRKSLGEPVAFHSRVLLRHIHETKKKRDSRGTQTSASEPKMLAATDGFSGETEGRLPEARVSDESCAPLPSPRHRHALSNRTTDWFLLGYWGALGEDYSSDFFDFLAFECGGEESVEALENSSSLDSAEPGLSTLFGGEERRAEQTETPEKPPSPPLTSTFMTRPMRVLSSDGLLTGAVAAALESCREHILPRLPKRRPAERRGNTARTDTTAASPWPPNTKPSKGKGRVYADVLSWIQHPDEDSETSSEGSVEEFLDETEDRRVGLEECHRVDGVSSVFSGGVELMHGREAQRAEYMKESDDFFQCFLQLVQLSPDAASLWCAMLMLHTHLYEISNGNVHGFSLESLLNLTTPRHESVQSFQERMNQITKQCQQREAVDEDRETPAFFDGIQNLLQRLTALNQNEVWSPSVGVGGEETTEQDQETYMNPSYLHLYEVMKWSATAFDLLKSTR